MIVFPNCPKSNDLNLSLELRCKGTLVPLSSSTREYEKWKCTVCGHEIE